MSQHIRLNTQGILDTDNDPQAITGGNYVEALNVRHRDVSGNAMNTITPVKGNTFTSPWDGKTFPIPTDLTKTIQDVGASVARFRIYIDVSLDPLAIYEGTVSLESGSNLYSFTVSGGSAYIPLATQYTNLTTLLQSGWTPAYPSANPFTIGALVTTSALTGYFDVVRNAGSGTPLNNDFLLFGGGTLCTIVQTSEFIDIPAGYTTWPLKVIGFETIDTDTFVWSCTPEIVSGTPALTVSEIGVIHYDEDNSTTQYTRLLRCKRLGFSPNYQIQAQAERQGNVVNLYWTDGFNPPRTLTIPYDKTLYNPYVEDCALSINGGNINYANVESQTSLVITNPTSRLTIDGLMDGGGSITCGNKRYTGRFLTDDYVPSDYIYPTNPINVYSAKINVPSEIKGDAPGTITNKGVKLTLSEYPANQFKYFELVAIEYEGDIFSAKVLERYDIEGVSELTMFHTNEGQLNIEVSAPELLAITNKIKTAQSLKITSNRMFMSNLEVQIDADLEAWAESITHSLEIGTINSIYRATQSGAEDCFGSYPYYTNGEYLDANNTVNFTSYMMNDTYRFGVQVQWSDTGKWSNAYWVDDIRFDLSANNVVGGRRTANNITTTNFTDIDSKLTYYYYVKFGNIDLSYSINGKPLYKQIQAYRFVRAERIPEVLATGLLLAGTQFDNGTDPTVEIIPYHRDVNRTFGTFSYYPDSYIRRFRKGAANTGSRQLGQADYSQYVYFHSPDYYLNNDSYQYRAGDKIKVLGVPFSYNQNTLQGQCLGDFESVYEDMTGYFSASLRTYTDFNIVRHQFMETGGVSSGGWGAPVDKVNNYIEIGPFTAPPIDSNKFIAHYRAANVFQLSSKISTTMPAGYRSFTDGGLVYGQLFRDLGANRKYPVEKRNTQYQSTGHIYNLTGNERGVVNNVSVYGGDVFNQKSHMSVRMSNSNPLPKNGFGQGYSFYSQNICNSQMFYSIEHNLSAVGPGYIYPQYMDKTQVSATTTYIEIRDTFTPTATFVTAEGYIPVPVGTWGAGLMYWLELWPEVSNQNNYDSQYNYVDGTITDQGFDSTITFDGKKPATIAWSQTKTTGSDKDNYRIFKPIDYVDLDLNHGPIVHHDLVNGFLYTWQPESFRRQYVNEGSAIVPENGSDIIVGAGGVLTIPGIQISSYGSTKKWSIIRGKSRNGDDTVYWYNDRLKKMLRFAADGTTVISDRGFHSYLQQNTGFVNRYDQPITGYGVNTGWNDRYKEAMFTFKGVTPSAGQFTIGTSYAVNDITVNNDLGGISSLITTAPAPRHISGMSYVYRCKVAHTGTANTAPGTGASWTTYWEQRDPETYPQYYNMFTVAYDEMKGGYTSLFSFWPNIYGTINDRFYTTRPNIQNKVYSHNGGAYNTFYDTGYNGHITHVVNADPNLSKTYEAVQVVSETTPNRLDFTTRDHVSYLTSGEFEELEDFYYAPVKNDSTGTGLNNGDTSRLWGRYMKIKFTFAPNVFQKLFNYIIKFRPNSRLYNK